MKKNRQKLLRSLVEGLSGIGKEMHSSQGFSFGTLKVSRPQVMILFFIAEQKNSTSVKDLAKFLHITPGGVSQFINNMVVKKLLIREEDVSDRRSINIKMTPVAKRQFNNFKNKYLMSISRVFDSLSLEELERLIELIGKIKRPPGDLVKNL